MNMRMICCGAALVLAGGLLTAQTTNSKPSTRPLSSDPPNAINIGGHRAIKDFRMRGPVLAYKAETKVFVDAPPSASDLLLENPDAYDVTVTLARNNLDGSLGEPVAVRVPLQTTEPIATRPSSQPARSQPATATRPAATQTTRPRRQPLFTGEAVLPLKDAEPGAFRLTMTVTKDGTVVTSAKETLLYLPRAARVTKDREEILTWLDEANEQQPIWGWRPTWTNLLLAIDNPEDPFANLRGFVLRSYDNPQLERRQPYTMYIPHALDLKQPQPLLVVLHGSGGDYRNIISDEAAGQRYEKFPMLVANAGAFRNQEFRHMALNDVRWVVEDVKRKYNVDASRIYVQGISLGGRGTLELAALLPDVFAAGSSHGTYGLNDDAVDPFHLLTSDAVAAHLSLRSDMRTFLPNLRNTPMEIVFGWKDDTTPAGGALMLAAGIREAGGMVVERGFNTTHNISLPDYDWASTREWLLKHKLEPKPLTVKHRVTNLRFNTNRWVTVHELQEYAVVGSVEGNYNPETKALTVKALNIAAATFAPPGPIESIIANGQVVELTTPRVSATLLFTNTRAGQRIGLLDKPLVADNAAKRPGISGPMWDVFSEPFTFVYGGSDDAAARERLKKSAEFAADWDMAFGGDKFASVAFESLTESQKRSRNLIAFLTPADVAKLYEQPGKLWPDTPAQATIRMALRPSPFASDRSILIVELSEKEPVNIHDLGWWDAALHTDWLLATVVQRTEPTRRRQRVRELRLLQAGMYDHHWNVGARTAADYRREALLGPGSRGN